MQLFYFIEIKFMLTYACDKRKYGLQKKGLIWITAKIQI